MVFNGTAVSQGVGRAVVTATGMATQMGQIAGLLHATREDPTPLQREIARVGKMLGVAVIIIAVVVMATIFAFFEVETVDEVVTALLLGVSLAVAAVPEGLPTILSVVLALGVQRMATHNAIVKKLSSVETLGSASVVCSDKTGTLTRGEMTIGRVVTASGEHGHGSGYRPDGRWNTTGPAGGGPLWARRVRPWRWEPRQQRRPESGGALDDQGDRQAAFLVAVKLGTRHRAGRFQRWGDSFTSERKMMTRSKPTIGPDRRGDEEGPGRSARQCTRAGGRRVSRWMTPGAP
jgi:magnesium-transporting ATPase (P-type)